MRSRDTRRDTILDTVVWHELSNSGVVRACRDDRDSPDGTFMITYCSGAIDVMIRLRSNV